MQLVNKWQRVSLLLILIVALGVSACTAATSEPAAPVEAVQPLESERVETERAPARNSEGMVGTQNGELTGTLEAVNGDQWTIAGQTFLVTNQTEVKGTFAPGDQIKVHVLSPADGTPVLREVEPAGVDDDGDDSTQAELKREERELIGTLEMMDDDLWTINGQTFAVTTQTEVEGDFSIGDQVKIHFFNGEDGALTLREIELAGGDDDVDHDADDDSDDDDMDDDFDDDIDDDSDDDIDDDSDDDMDDDSDDEIEDDSDDADDDSDDSVEDDSDDDDMDDGSDDDSDDDSDHDIDDDSDDSDDDDDDATDDDSDDSDDRDDDDDDD